MSSNAEPGSVQALAKFILAALCASCVLASCGCAGKQGEEGAVDLAVKYASVRTELDTSESSVALTTPDARIDITPIAVEDAPDGKREIVLDPAIISDTMASWTASEWAENRVDLYFHLSAHFDVVCKQAHEYSDLPEGYIVTCPDYMVVYDSQKSKGFIVDSTGVYEKTDDPDDPIGEPIVLAAE